MYVAGRLARQPASREAALALGRNIADQIAKETDTSAQINSYGSLARAMWPASRSEAKAYFKRGLEFADALGSDNYEKIVELMSFAARYSGSPLSPPVTHSFAAICELNLPEESEKFAWVTYAQAMSRIAGASALANVARLADRRRVDLSYSLPPLLTALAKDNRLASDLASALIGLDEPVETWSWLQADFLEVILPRLPEQHRENVIGFILCEIDRQYRGSPPRESIERITALAPKYLPKESASRTRLASLQPDAGVQSAFATPSEVASPIGVTEPPLPDAVLSGVDITSALAIDAVLQAKDSDEAARRWPVRVMEALAQPIRGVDQRCRFLRAISETQIPDLLDKLTVLNNLVPQWGEQSAAVTDILPELAQQLAARHAPELIESDWDSSYTLSSTARIFRPSAVQTHSNHHHRIARSYRPCPQYLVAQACDRYWQHRFSKCNSVNAGEILKQIRRLFAQDLGDGPWTEKLMSPRTEPKVVAGLIWQRLGSPVAADRWRAAHALRRLVHIGRSDVLPLLIASADATDAGPFQDQKSPFFHLHAKLWLHIALARIALDSPESVKPFNDRLQSTAFDPAFPHVLIRHFAGQALTRIAGILPSADRSKLLTAVSQLSVPRAKQSDINHPALHESRPREHPEPQNPFHYDYDFTKYKLDSVARLFAVPQWQIEDTCTKWIRNWSSDVRNMYSCPRIKQHYGDGVGDWSSGSVPSHDLWGGHLAWHALMLTVGELLPTKPVMGYPWDEDPWREWFSGQILSSPMGLWLADGTDPFPRDLRRPLKPADGSNDGVPNDPRIFAELLGLSPELALNASLIVDGYWHGPDAIDISVQSVIVKESDAMSVALTVALGEPFHRYIPDHDNHGLSDEHSIAAKLIRSWTTSPSDPSLHLDRHDPYAGSTALTRPRPTEEFAKKFGLACNDAFYKTWTLNGTQVFAAEAWGSRRGTGRYETERQGSRLFCRVQFLKQWLAAEKSQLVFLVKAQKYLEKQDRDGSGTFRTETLTGLLCPKRGVRVIRRIPSAVRAAVTALPKNDRSFFEPRLLAIRKALRH